MSTFAKDFRAAFNSIWAQVGMLISAVAVFKFLTEVLQIGLSGLSARLLSVFRFVFHPIIDVLTFWLPFELSELGKDVLVLWFAIGGATARAFVAYRSRIAPTHGAAHNRSFNVLVRSPTLWPMGFVLCLIAWPVMLPIFFGTPIVVRSLSDGASRRRDPYECVNRSDWREQRAYRPSTLIYECDLRTVFALQLGAVVAVVTGLIVLNAAGGS